MSDLKKLDASDPGMKAGGNNNSNDGSVLNDNPSTNAGSTPRISTTSSSHGSAETVGLNDNSSTNAGSTPRKGSADKILAIQRSFGMTGKLSMVQLLTVIYKSEGLNLGAYYSPDDLIFVEKLDMDEGDEDYPTPVSCIDIYDNFLRTSASNLGNVLDGSFYRIAAMHYPTDKLFLTSSKGIYIAADSSLDRIIGDLIASATPQNSMIAGNIQGVVNAHPRREFWAVDKFEMRTDILEALRGYDCVYVLIEDSEDMSDLIQGPHIMKDSKNKRTGPLHNFLCAISEVNKTFAAMDVNIRVMGTLAQYRRLGLRLGVGMGPGRKAIASPSFYTPMCESDVDPDLINLLSGKPEFAEYELNESAKDFSEGKVPIPRCLRITSTLIPDQAISSNRVCSGIYSDWPKKLANMIASTQARSEMLDCGWIAVKHKDEDYGVKARMVTWHPPNTLLFPHLSPDNAVKCLGGIIFNDRQIINYEGKLYSITEETILNKKIYPVAHAGKLSFSMESIHSSAHIVSESIAKSFLGHPKFGDRVVAFGPCEKFSRLCRDAINRGAESKCREKIAKLSTDLNLANPSEKGGISAKLTLANSELEKFTGTSVQEIDSLKDHSSKVKPEFEEFTNAKGLFGSDG